MKDFFKILVCISLAGAFLEADEGKVPVSQPNHLEGALSPYLLQHASNPVDWYPWGNEAFALAKKLDRPIFLSIGYATCHWCHVMAHESFEDPEVAKLMNSNFVNIKVDREERPDIDQIYMSVCQMMTGSGGWPLSIIMTPEKKPFFAATYIPKTSRHGRIGMVELVPKVHEAWVLKRSSLEENAQDVIRNLKQQSQQTSDEKPDSDVAKRAFNSLAGRYDALNGGFGKEPKFPSPHNLLFLLHQSRWHGNSKAKDMVTATLKAMHRGGIYDQVGFGLHRYSTDAKWLLPHFEKMLYDQAMLMLASAEAAELSGEKEFHTIVEEIYTYLDRDLSAPGGAFYSAEDADSEGEEGRFYLWTEAELKTLLTPEDFLFASRLWNTSPSGNFMAEASIHSTRDNILHLSPDFGTGKNDSSEAFRKRKARVGRLLLEARSQRTRPLRDEKILTDWNALTAVALARAGRLFQDQKLIDRAEECVDFLNRNLQNSRGQLLHRYFQGKADIPAFLDDVVFLGWAELELYRATLEVRHLERSLGLMDLALAGFQDPSSGGFFMTSGKSEKLLIRAMDAYDTVLPSGNSVAAHLLLDLSRLTAKSDYAEKAERVFLAFGTDLTRRSAAMSWMADAWEKFQRPSTEIVLVGSRKDEITGLMLKTIREFRSEDPLLLLIEPGKNEKKIHALAPFTANYHQIDGQPTAYLCRDGSCRLPTANPDVLRRLLKETGREENRITP